MSAARKKSTVAKEIETVDLISLLTIPGQDGIYEAEIAIAEPGEIVEEPEYIPDSLPSTSTKAPVQSEKAPQNKPGKVDSLDSLSALMQQGKTGRTRSATSTAKASNSVSFALSENVGDDSFEKIAEEIAGCQKCELHKTRNKTVPGQGHSNARIVFIGEAPGAEEDASGIPFVGRAGKHLDKILAAVGFNREEIFICNILKCRPPGNRNPTLEEMICCTPYLQRQLQLVRPRLIACLGNVAIKYVIGSDTPGITRIHGEWFKSIFGIETMAMYHPSYLVRSESREPGSPNWQMWQDIKKLKKRFDELA
jgi:DNA polymerase